MEWQGDEHEDYVMAAAALARSTTLHARLSYFRRREHRYLIPFYPCRFDCEWALRYANGTYEAIARRARRGEAELLRDALVERLELTPDGAIHPGELGRPGALRLFFDVF